MDGGARRAPEREREREREEGGRDGRLWRDHERDGLGAGGRERESG